MTTVTIRTGSHLEASDGFADFLGNFQLREAGGFAGDRFSLVQATYDNVLKISSMVVPGALSFATPVELGLLGVTELQTARLNVVAYPPDPCVGQLSFVNSNGAQVGNTLDVQLAPGQATFLELPGGTLVTKLGQRAEVQPIVTVDNGSFAASTEVYLNGFGTTSVYYPPEPCSAASTSCVP